MIALVRPECPKPEALAAGIYDDPDNKNALAKAASGKCMYCESKIGHVSYPQIEHIKPKKKFPELEFVWENLGFCCQICNTNKGQKYDEARPFINPYNENPEDHIGFLGYYIYPKHGSLRGEYTIKEIGLERNELNDRRKEKIDGVEKMIKAAFSTKSDSLRNQAIDEIKKEAGKDMEYSAAIESVLIAHEIISK